MLYPPTDPETTGEDLLIDADDEPVARITLRLPQSVKARSTSSPPPTASPPTPG